MAQLSLSLGCGRRHVALAFELQSFPWLKDAWPAVSGITEELELKELRRLGNVGRPAGERHGIGNRTPR